METRNMNKMLFRKFHIKGPLDWPIYNWQVNAEMGFSDTNLMMWTGLTDWYKF
jgi:hypothetical protein